MSSFRNLVLTDEQQYPYAPEHYLANQEWDNGFSKGYGEHFHPVPAYFADCHVHYLFPQTGQAILDSAYRLLKVKMPYPVKKLLLLPPVGVGGWPLALQRTYQVRQLNPHLELERTDPNLGWAIYLRHDTPDPGFVEEAVAKGCNGVKLHMAPMLMEGVDYRVFLSPEWDKTFSTMEKYRLPVLFHITQTVMNSSYKAGSGSSERYTEQSYFVGARSRGLSYTNFDLLEMFQELLRRYPGITFVGAHELYMGLDRLDELFDQYANLCVDTCGGFTLIPFDHMYPQEAECYKKFFIKHADRLLFATDAESNFYQTEDEYRYFYERRMRFIMELHLPYDVLQKVCHSNCERIFGL